MRLFHDLDSGYLITGFSFGERINGDGVQDQLSGIKRGDSKPLELAVGRKFGTAEAHATPLTSYKFGAKVAGDYDGSYVVSNYSSISGLFEFTESGSGVTKLYTFNPSWNTTKLNNLLGYDPEGFAEVTEIRPIAGDDTGVGFQLYDQNGSVGFWIDLNNAGTTIPSQATVCTRAVEITTITTGDTAAEKATAIAAVINADAQFVATASGDVITVTDAEVGPRTAAADFTSTQASGFGISRWIAGSSPNTMANEDYVDLMGEFEATADGAVISTQPFTIRVTNDVNKGSEGAPTNATPAYPAPGMIYTMEAGGTLIVDVYGNDSTASRESLKAFATIPGARSAALNADTVFVRPAAHPITASFEKVDVNWEFQTGATVTGGGTDFVLDHSTGTSVIRGLRYTAGATGKGVNITGGTLILEDCYINTAANNATNPITKSGGTLILGAGTVLIAEATRDSISAATAQNVKVYPGCAANKAVDADVTQQVSTLTVSADVT